MIDKIPVAKLDLIQILMKNRATHRTVFLAAWEGYRKEAERLLAKRLAAIKAGRMPKKVEVILYAPQDHTPDYDRVIKIMEMYVGDTVILTEQDFAQYVQDDWAWKRAWLKMSSSYDSASTREAYASYFEEDEED